MSAYVTSETIFFADTFKKLSRGSSVQLTQDQVCISIVDMNYIILRTSFPCMCVYVWPGNEANHGHNIIQPISLVFFSFLTVLPNHA